VCEGGKGTYLCQLRDLSNRGTDEVADEDDFSPCSSLPPSSLGGRRRRRRRRRRRGGGGGGGGGGRDAVPVFG